MVLNTNTFFQWQNPELRKTIYPFREKKLRDFILIYEEIDLWKKIGKSPVDPQIASKITGELAALQNRLAQAKQEKLQADQAIVDARKKNHQVLSSKPAIELLTRKINSENNIARLKVSMDTVKRRVDWYSQNAPDHPYYTRFQAEYQAAKEAYDKATAELNSIVAQYATLVGPVQTEMKGLTDRQASLAAEVVDLTIKVRAYPRIDKTGVTQRLAVRWQMKQRENELSLLTHDQLLAKVLERFDREPQRFPKWLQYMVIHFSGMRYKSAHASWANPRDLVEALETDAVRTKYLKPAPQILDQDCAQAITELRAARQIAPNPQAAQIIDRQIAALSNNFQRQTALVNYLTTKTVGKADTVTEEEALKRLQAMQSQMPGWVWKEIVARTQLRLNTTDPNWETLTPEEQKARADWNDDNERWQEIINAWERKEITGWRAEHARTLELIVSRAVCNEIAEHIQHLRGLNPPGGLTAKPNWYLGLQKKGPPSFFRRPNGIADMKIGASILWLGWVTQRPNAWQIANPLPGIDLLGGSLPPGTPVVDKKSEKKVAPVTAATAPAGLFLRWTHEATIVEVAEMADGWQVLTFETGKIGLNLRFLNHLVGNWDVFVGFTPGTLADPPNLAAMLDRQKILPPGLGLGEESFGFEGEVIEAEVEEVVEFSPRELRRRWNALSKRQKQVLALYCQGESVRLIASRLDTSTGNVRKQLNGAVTKFGAYAPDELAARLSGWDFSGVAVP